MRIVINDNTKTDIAFTLWIITEYIFAHTLYSQIALMLYFLVVLFRIFTNKRIVLSKVFISYLIFGLICCMNIWFGYSINKMESYKLISTIWLNFLFFVTTYNYLKYRSLHGILSVLNVSALIISLFLWILNFTKTGSLIFRTSGGINGNGMSILNAFVISLILTTGAFKKRKYIICLALLFFFCVISGTRKSFILVLVIMTVYYCFRYPKKLPKYIIEILIVGAISYFALLNIPFLYRNIGVRLESLFYFLQGGQGDGSIISRANFIELGMRYFYKSPLWGNGVNCFKTISGSFGTYSHNNYVELLFSLGIIGTISYYFIYISIILKAIKDYRWNRNSSSVISIAIIIACLITDYAQVVYYDRGSILFLVVALSIIGNKDPIYDCQIQN